MSEITSTCPHKSLHHSLVSLSAISSSQLFICMHIRRIYDRARRIVPCERGRDYVSPKPKLPIVSKIACRGIVDSFCVLAFVLFAIM